jgi:hypothetical protein
MPRVSINGVPQGSGAPTADEVWEGFGDALDEDPTRATDLASVLGVGGTPASASTTGATETTCGSYTLPTNTAVLIELTVRANRTDRTAGAMWGVRAHAINAAGTVTISGGDIAVDGPIGSAVTWSVTLDVSGTAVRLRVTGEAATDLTWTARWIVS